LLRCFYRRNFTVCHLPHQLINQILILQHNITPIMILKLNDTELIIEWYFVLRRIIFKELFYVF
jgi:hypothetical protein